MHESNSFTVIVFVDLVSSKILDVVPVSLFGGKLERGIGEFINSNFLKKYSLQMYRWR